MWQIDQQRSLPTNGSTHISAKHILLYPHVLINLFTLNCKRLQIDPQIFLWNVFDNICTKCMWTYLYANRSSLTDICWFLSGLMFPCTCFPVLVSLYMFPCKCFPVHVSLYTFPCTCFPVYIYPTNTMFPCIVYSVYMHPANMFLCTCTLPVQFYLNFLNDIFVS